MAFFGERNVLRDIPRSSLVMRGSPSSVNIPYHHEVYGAPSPEEQIIRQRSREPPSFSSFDFCDENIIDTADFLQATPVKEPFTLLPRKRLLLTPCASSTPEKDVSKIKRRRLNKRSDTPLNTELKAFSCEQLVQALDKLVSSHPELEKEVRGSLKCPDIKPLQTKLAYLRKNIYKALPTVRYGSSRDAHCFQRVKIHLNAFKRACVEQGKQLVEAKCWASTIHYVLTSWKYVHQLPKWDDPSHNIPQQQCFRSLSAQCMEALRDGSFSVGQLKEFHSKLDRCAALNSEIQPCVEHIERILMFR